MKRILAAAAILAALTGPALADTAGGNAALGHDQVMGQEVFSSDGQSIGNVVDALVAPDGQLVAVAVVDPKAPEVGLALPAELLSVNEGKLTAKISTEEIAALPDPDSSSDDQTPQPETLPDPDRPVEQ